VSSSGHGGSSHPSAPSCSSSAGVHPVHGVHDGAPQCGTASPAAPQPGMEEAGGSPRAPGPRPPPASRLVGWTPHSLGRLPHGARSARIHPEAMPPLAVPTAPTPEANKGRAHPAGAWAEQPPLSRSPLPHLPSQPCSRGGAAWAGLEPQRGGPGLHHPHHVSGLGRRRVLWREWLRCSPPYLLCICSGNIHRRGENTTLSAGTHGAVSNPLTPDPQTALPSSRVTAAGHGGCWALGSRLPGWPPTP
jgi:hypothetical protein